MRRFIKDNRGMTLIELLIAITILGLVAAPLLHGFLTSAQTEVKARKMGEVTSVAQNVMETVEGNEFDKVVELTTYQGTGNYYTVLDDEYKNPSATHTGGDDYHIGLTGYPMNGKAYDVMIDVEASKYNQLNDVDKLSVNSEMDKVFKASKTDVSADCKITMNVTSTTKDGKAAIKFEVMQALGTADPGEPADYTYIIPADNEKAAIYLLYYPSYKKSDSGYVYAKDIIEINNLADIEFDLYLIKQKATGFTDAELKVVDPGAECHIVQNLSGNYTAAINISGADIYSNVKENLGDDSLSVQAGKVTYEIKCGPTQGETLVGNLLPFQTEGVARDRIYAVTVKVFENGSGFAGEPLSTLKGAILK